MIVENKNILEFGQTIEGTWFLKTNVQFNEIENFGTYLKWK